MICSRFLFNVFFLISGFTAAAQDNTVDSLRNVLQNPKLHDTTRLQVLSTFMGERYSIDDPKYYDLNSMLESLALKNYRKKNPPKLAKIYAGYLAEAYSSAALREERNRDFVKAFAYINKSIALYRKASALENMHFAIVTKGTLYSDIQEYEKAIECFFTALRYFEKAQEEYSASGVIYVYTYLGQIYLKQNKYNDAITYYQKVNRHFSQLPELTPQDKHEQSYVYGNLGHCYAALKNYPAAFSHYRKAVALAESIGDQVTVDMIQGKIASLMISRGEYDEATVILQELVKRDLDPVATTSNFINLGKLYDKKQDYEKANYFLTRALEKAQQNKQLELQEEASQLLHRVSVSRKDFQKALEMYVLHDQLTDSTRTEASRNALTQQQLKYDFEKKELKLKLDAEKEAATKNSWLIALASGLLVSLSGGYFFYRNSKQRQAIAVLEKNQIRQKLLITQMNPHFIFNSIVNIRALITSRKNEDATHYLDRFATLTRQILENSNENYISLAEEVEMTRNYLSIQQLLYSEKFDYTLYVDSDLVADDIFLPPMLTQPFIENAIKHGLSNKPAGGRIDVRFFMDKGKLYFEVKDNGKGFETEKGTTDHKSLAMKITRERLATYTRNSDLDVKTETLIATEGDVAGAKVVFEIPYIYEN